MDHSPRSPNVRETPTLRSCLKRPTPVTSGTFDPSYDDRSGRQQSTSVSPTLHHAAMTAAALDASTRSAAMMEPLDISFLGSECGGLDATLNGHSYAAVGGVSPGSTLTLEPLSQSSITPNATSSGVLQNPRSASKKVQFGCARVYGIPSRPVSAGASSLTPTSRPRREPTVFPATSMDLFDAPSDHSSGGCERSPLSCQEP